LAVQQVGSYLGYTDRNAEAPATGTVERYSDRRSACLSRLSNIGGPPWPGRDRHPADAQRRDCLPRLSLADGSGLIDVSCVMPAYRRSIRRLAHLPVSPVDPAHPRRLLHRRTLHTRSTTFSPCDDPAHHRHHPHDTDAEHQQLHSRPPPVDCSPRVSLSLDSLRRKLPSFFRSRIGILR
jgi:hypothetical protein